ncbi:MAG: hypothetical protein R2736_04485 [Solirubrobacterales bacterium]
MSVLVTADSGARPLGDAGPQPPANRTLLGLLDDGFDVRASAGRVQAIDGQAGPWGVFVNGLREPGDPAHVEVHAGDRVWWDAHDGDENLRVPRRAVADPARRPGGAAARPGSARVGPRRRASPTTGARWRCWTRAGHAVRTLGPGAGLVAATVYEDQPPTWFVTGTDADGVAAAVQAFDEPTLANRFVLAVGDHRGIPLPVGSG